MISLDLARWLPSLAGIIGGTSSGGLLIAWWRHRERTRAQTDETALSLVKTLGGRIETLEHWVRDLQHRLANAEAEKRSLFWLLKYCPEDRRQEAVADVERQMREAEERRNASPIADVIAELRGQARQAAQIHRSATNVAADAVTNG